MADVTMPQLGETVTEGTIIKWLKAVGDPVAEDEALFEVSTDKVDSEVPATVTGQVKEILVAEGETVDVGTKLAVIAEGGAVDGDSGAPPAPEPSAATADPEPEPEAAAPAEPEPARRAARSEPAPSKTDAPAPSASASDGAPGVLLSPVVRKLVAEHNLDPDAISGTGQGGRITRADVLSHIDRNGGARRQASAPAAAPTKQAAPAKPVKPTFTPGADGETVRFSNIRRRTAEHMIRSQATSAHVLTVTEVDYYAVESVRLAVRDEFKATEGFSLTYLPFIARAVVDALADFPHLNASVGNDELILHRHIHLGFAVDLNFEGLIVPVIREAETKRLRAIAAAVADLAKRARSRELSADDISGGTFTITNPGPFGTFITAPVINQPQVGILSTDGIKKRPVAVELPDGTDAVAIHPVGNLALSFDHRAIDGAYASAFLGRCRDILETRDWSQEV
ncbi:MAG TPA: dihydrolipoamide acetyltransferase family protein [Acidimicrobiales bacterium]|nr:dihydrolipoamide acetyltransferase family protein [Acidimicrobiales bacterium]